MVSKALFGRKEPLRDRPHLCSLPACARPPWRDATLQTHLTPRRAALTASPGPARGGQNRHWASAPAFKHRLKSAWMWPMSPRTGTTAPEAACGGLETADVLSSGSGRRGQITSTACEDCVMRRPGYAQRMAVMEMNPLTALL